MGKESLLLKAKYQLMKQSNFLKSWLNFHCPPFLWAINWLKQPSSTLKTLVPRDYLGM